MKNEFGICGKKEGLFDCAKEGSTPRVLIGLKNGALLAKNITESELLAMGLKTPWLSPSLQVSRTALNAKLLITGSLGINPLLVENGSNYPRFKLLVEQDMVEEEILDKIMTQIKDLEEILGKNSAFQQKNRS